MIDYNFIFGNCCCESGFFMINMINSFDVYMRFVSRKGGFFRRSSIISNLKYQGRNIGRFKVKVNLESYEVKFI